MDFKIVPVSFLLIKDQPTAIKKLGEGKLERTVSNLLGVTGSGKTLTVAMVEEVQRPTRIVSQDSSQQLYILNSRPFLKML
jgi:excinuclease UvrABC helicase subunit UvrB